MGNYALKPHHEPNVVHCTSLSLEFILTPVQCTGIHTHPSAVHWSSSSPSAVYWSSSSPIAVHWSASSPSAVHFTSRSRRPAQSPVSQRRSQSVERPAPAISIHPPIVQYAVLYCTVL